MTDADRIAAKLTAPQERVLRGQRPQSNSHAGGQTGSVLALRRKGLLGDDGEPTDLGTDVIKSLDQRGKA